MSKTSTPSQSKGKVKPSSPSSSSSSSSLTSLLPPPYSSYSIFHVLLLSSSHPSLSTYRQLFVSHSSSSTSSISVVNIPLHWDNFMVSTLFSSFGDVQKCEKKIKSPSHHSSWNVIFASPHDVSALLKSLLSSSADSPIRLSLPAAPINSMNYETFSSVFPSSSMLSSSPFTSSSSSLPSSSSSSTSPSPSPPLSPSYSLSSYLRFYRSHHPPVRRLQRTVNSFLQIFDRKVLESESGQPEMDADGFITVRRRKVSLINLHENNQKVEEMKMKEKRKEEVIPFYKQQHTAASDALASSSSSSLFSSTPFPVVNKGNHLHLFEMDKNKRNQNTKKKRKFNE